MNMSVEVQPESLFHIPLHHIISTAQAANIKAGTSTRLECVEKRWLGGLENNPLGNRLGKKVLI